MEATDQNELGRKGSLQIHLAELVHMICVVHTNPLLLLCQLNIDSNSSAYLDFGFLSSGVGRASLGCIPQMR